jgi:hypothetical protein
MKTTYQNQLNLCHQIGHKIYLLLFRELFVDTVGF